MSKYGRTAAAVLAVGVLAVAGASMTYGASVHGADSRKALEQDAFATSKAAVGNRLADQRFLDARGEPVDLGNFRGKPLIVNMIYTSCDHTCPMITSHLARAADVAWDALGADSFAVVTIGFDVRHDSPMRMRTYANQHGIDVPSWKFLSGDAQTIEAVSKDLGFSYRRSPHGFDHIAQVSVLDAEGRLYRQVYGQVFDPPAIVEPLKQLVFGQVAEAASLSGWINGVRLFCTVYDPSSERYRFDYSIVIAFAVGFLCLGGVAVFLVRAWMQSSRSPNGSRAA